MLQKLRAFLNAGNQNKFFVFMWAVYMIAIVWTTVQAYARLRYIPHDTPKNVVVETKN